MSNMNSFEDPGSLDKEYQEFVRMQADNAQVLSVTNPSILNNTSAIKNLFNDPYSNNDSIASAMEELYNRNGIIKGIIKYLQSHLTFNHAIYPKMTVETGFEPQEDLSEYGEVANYIDLYNIKYFAPFFVKEMLIKGTVYLYELSDKSGVSYMQFPTSWCRVNMMENGLFRWELDMSNISEMSEIFPKEIQNAYETFNGGGTISEDDKNWSEGQWYRLSDKGFALALDQNIMTHGVAISELSNTLLESSSLEKAKGNVEVKDDLDTIRLIHSKIPVDNSGKVKMSASMASKYNQQVNRSLPRGVASVTSPLEITNVPINGAGDKSAYDMVNKAEEQLFLSTGTPANLFGADTSSSRIVQLAIQKDANWLYTNVLTLLENYYNYRLGKFKTQSGMSWRLNFIRQSYYTLKDDINFVKEQLSFGGSRLDYLAAVGMSPSEILGKLIMEQKMINIDSIMLPKQTSHTMSSGSSSPTNGGDVGRPETETPTEGTERIRDAE